MTKNEGKLLVSQNKKARHEYHIHDCYEAGLVLLGTEVKSLRQGKCSLVDAYVVIVDGEGWLKQAHIPEYHFGTNVNHAPKRPRKLLLHRRELDKLLRSSSESGKTIVPLSLYFKDGKAKVEIALATGKKDWDKRATIAKREAEREAQRALANRNRLRR